MTTGSFSIFAIRDSENSFLDDKILFSKSGGTLWNLTYVNGLQKITHELVFNDGQMFYYLHDLLVLLSVDVDPFLNYQFNFTAIPSIMLSQKQLQDPSIIGVIITRIFNMLEQPTISY
jgi:hypothetical protein